MKYIFSIFLLFSTLHAEEKLKILSPHWEGIKYESARGFENYMLKNFDRKVSIEWLDAGGGTSEMLRFIEGEFKRAPDGIGVDILFGGGTDPFQFLDEKKLLEPMTLSENSLKDIPNLINNTPIRSETNTWIAPLVASFGILCNKKVIEFLNLSSPYSWSDLTKPELKTWIGAADPRKSGSMHAALEVILQGFGWEKGWKIILEIAANVRSFSGASSIATMQVASGDIACTLAVDSQAWNQMKLDPKQNVTFALPKEFTLINGDGIAVLKGSKNKELGEKFIEFLLSDEGQKLFFLPVGVPGGPQKYHTNRLVVKEKFYSEYKGVAQNLINPFERKDEINYDYKKASLRWGILNELFRVFMMEASQEIPREKFLNLYLKIPKEDEILRIVQSSEWSDPIHRHQITEQWKILSLQ